MANNTSTSAVVPVDLTVFEQWLQFILFYISFGAIGALGNIAIAVGIARSKKLRSRFFIVVLTLVCVRVTIAYEFIAMGLFRTLKALHVVDMNQKRITCHLLHMFVHVSFSVELCLLVVLVIDRMLAIMAPLLYKNLSRRQAKIVCVGVVVILGVFCKMVPSFIGWDFNEIVPCVNSYSATTPALNLYAQNTDFPIIITVLVLYYVLLLHVKLRIRALKRERSVDAEMQLKRKTVVLPLLRNVILAHSIVTLTSKLLASLIVYFPYQAIRLAAYSGNLNTVDLIINVVVLLWSNIDIKEASLPRCCLKHAANSAAFTSTNRAGAGTGTAPAPARVAIG